MNPIAEERPEHTFLRATCIAWLHDLRPGAEWADLDTPLDRQTVEGKPGHWLTHNRIVQVHRWADGSAPMNPSIPELVAAVRAADAELQRIYAARQHADAAYQKTKYTRIALADALLTATPQPGLTEVPLAALERPEDRLGAVQDALKAYDRAKEENWLSHSQNDPTRDKLVEAIRYWLDSIPDPNDVGEGYRKPVDGEEAVIALRDGVLERDMTGIPHGEGGWHPCGMIEANVRQGLGKFRVPVDWTPNPKENHERS